MGETCHHVPLSDAPYPLKVGKNGSVGCLAQGHSNLFIPSTLNGRIHALMKKLEKLSKDKYQANMESAMDVYIS